MAERSANTRGEANGVSAGAHKKGENMEPYGQLSKLKPEPFAALIRAINQHLRPEQFGRFANCVCLHESPEANKEALLRFLKTIAQYWLRLYCGGINTKGIDRIVEMFSRYPKLNPDDRIASEADKGDPTSEATDLLRMFLTTMDVDENCATSYLVCFVEELIHLQKRLSAPKLRSSSPKRKSAAGKYLDKTRAIATSVSQQLADALVASLAA
jgi:hypothetical protein